MKNQNKGKWGLKYRNHDKFDMQHFFFQLIWYLAEMLYFSCEIIYHYNSVK